MSHPNSGLRLAVIGGGALITFGMLLPNVAQAACGAYAKDPYATRIAGQRAIMAVGVRGTDCKERKLLIVRLREHRRFWPDKTLAEVRFTVTNGALRTHYLCNGSTGERDVFTETWVQGEGKHKSGPLKFKACG